MAAHTFDEDEILFNELDKIKVTFAVQDNDALMSMGDVMRKALAEVEAAAEAKNKALTKALAKATKTKGKVKGKARPKL
jgi:DNA invertase Pin-like site-specific DNA recombinase